MVKYTTKDLIERAEQFADLQNSDFLSPKEKQNLLNESWIKVYQKIINANDKTFIKSVHVSSNCRLPSDFYQMESLYLARSHEQITRMNASQLTGYEIKNNIIRFSPGYHGHDIIMNYYPSPETLFYKSTDKTQIYDYTVKPRIYLDKGCFISDDGSIYLDDAVAGSVVSKMFCMNNGYLTFANNNAVLHSYDDTDSLEVTAGDPLCVVGNSFTFDKIEGTIPEGALVVIMDQSQNQLYWIIAEDNHYYLTDRTKTQLEELSENEFYSWYCRQDGLYRTNGAVLTRFNNSIVETFKEGLFKTTMLLDDIDAVYCFNNKEYKGNYGINTLLEYPNNLYYIYMAYDLAISFKLKQNGDVNNLSVKLAEAEKQLMDSISRDVNANYQIKNVYSTGFYRW